MIGSSYWSTGIELKRDGSRWSASISFYDDGFCNYASTEGKLYLRYFVDDPIKAARILKSDADALGIKWREEMSGCPTVYVENDGETGDSDHPELRVTANAVAIELGWEPCYTTSECQPA